MSRLRSILCCGFLLLAATAGSSGAVVIERVQVGAPGNADDTTGVGAVATTFYIGKFEITNAQYVEFLNLVDPTGVDLLALWDQLMMNAPDGGIDRDGFAPNGMKYSAKPGRENHPVVFVSFYDMMRFANWLHNGQGTGDTENGAYTLLGGTATPSNGNTVLHNAGAKFWIPTEDEWYKAAYYGGLGYFTYPTSNNLAPTPEAPPGGTNSANCNFVVLDSTDVGAYPNTVGPWGALDQGGNVWEVTEDIVLATARRMRGGSWGSDLFTLAKTVPSMVNSNAGFSQVGFRLAADSPGPSVPALPLPVAPLFALLLAGEGARRLCRAPARTPSQRT